MKILKTDNMVITIDKEGSRKYSKFSYPIRYGIYSEIQTKNYVYQFNLNGEIKHIHGRGHKWPHGDWLKRTAGNDWIYYTAGEYSNILSYIGEYYLPCFSYPSNSIFPYKPFQDNVVSKTINSVDQLLDQIALLTRKPIPSNIKDFLTTILKQNKLILNKKSNVLHNISGGQLSVLPPDARHVDYDVIPVIISDGCLYNCKFCNVKSGQAITERDKNNIKLQINRLKKFYNRDISNHNAVFLGNHDALFSGIDLIEFAVTNSYKAFDFSNAFMKGSNLFLFGSVSSFLNSTEYLFKFLNEIPFYTYINIGLESSDQLTLNQIGKPLKENDVKQAFFKMLDINKKYEGLEVTANFLLGQGLSNEHYKSFEELTGNNLNKRYSKGSIYLSSLDDVHTGREARNKFIKLKNASKLPVFVYIIQRL